MAKQSRARDDEDTFRLRMLEGQWRAHHVLWHSGITMRTGTAERPASSVALKPGYYIVRYSILKSTHPSGSQG